MNIYTYEVKTQINNYSGKGGECETNWTTYVIIADNAKEARAMIPKKDIEKHSEISLKKTRRNVGQGIIHTCSYDNIWD